MKKGIIMIGKKGSLASALFLSAILSLSAYATKPSRTEQSAVEQSPTERLANKGLAAKGPTRERSANECSATKRSGAECLVQWIDSTVESNSTVNDVDKQAMLAQRILRQMARLDHTLEQIGLAVYSGTAKVDDKKIVAAHIAELREILSRYIDTHSAVVTRGPRGPIDGSSLRALFNADAGVLAYVNQAAKNGFSGIDKFDEGMLVNRTYLNSPIDVEEMETLLGEFEAQIEVLGKNVKHIGYSSLNRIAKAIAHLNKKLKVTKFAKRALPYCALSAYVTLIHTDALWDFYTAGKKKYFTSNAAHAILEKVEKTAEPIVEFTRGHKAAGNAVFDISAAALIAPVIKKDLTDFAEWSGHQIGKGLAFLKGLPYDDGSPFKISKTTVVDVIGAEDAKQTLSRIVDYFKGRSGLNRSGAITERGYLLVGPLDTSKQLAYALAGEVTAHYKAKKKSTICTVRELHASELIEKKLKDIIKEAEEKAPCIVLIEDLDWLHTQPRVDATVWSNIATTLNGVLKSKKQVFVLASVRDASILESHHKGQVGMVVAVDYATLEDRAEFFKREFRKRGIAKSRFDIQALAQQTERCTFTQLTAIVNRALTKAHLAKIPLAQAHLEATIKEIVQGIHSKENVNAGTSRDEQTASFDETQVEIATT